MTQPPEICYARQFGLEFTEENIFNNLMTDKIQESTDDNASMNRVKTMGAFSRAG